MAFWLALGLWVGGFVLTELLRPKPDLQDARAAGIDELGIPTATEGLHVPIFGGMVLFTGANVVWAGDFRADPIREEIRTGLFSDETVTIGYQYFVGLQMAFARGDMGATVAEGGIKRVWMGDTIIYDGGETLGPIDIDDPEFLGGEEGQGGISFQIRLYPGSATQAADSYLAGQQVTAGLPVASAYRFTAYLAISGIDGGPAYVGNAPNLRPIKFEVYRFPNTLAVTGGAERIGDDMNPICFLHELLSNFDWGVILPGSEVLLTGTAADGALRAVGEQVATEGLGMSWIIRRPMRAEEIIDEIQQHVDGYFRADLVDGQYKIFLTRPAGDPANSGPGPLFDEDNSKLINYSSVTWEETQGSLRLRFPNRANEYSDTWAGAHDLGNERIRGKRDPATIKPPTVMTASVANKYVARTHRVLAYPLSKVELETDRAGADLDVGDCFRFTRASLGITAQPYRVIQVDDSDDNSSVRIAGSLDIFQPEQGTFADPGLTGFVPPSTTPVVALAERLWEVPYQLTPTVGQKHVATLAARNGGLQLGYEVWVDLAGGSSFEFSNRVQTWTPIADLQGALASHTEDASPYVDTITVDVLVDVTPQQLVDAASATVDSANPSNLLVINDEVMFWTAAVDNMDGSVDLTVQRGTVDTIPAAHADNDTVWFIGFGIGLLSPAPLAASLSGTIAVKLLPFTSTGTLTIATAATLNHTIEERALTPIPPGDPIINTERMADQSWTTIPGTLRMSWNTRNRRTQDLDVVQTDPDITQGSLVGATGIVRRVDTDAIVATGSFAQLGALNFAGFIPQTTPGVPDELDFYVTLDNREESEISQTWQTPNFEVFGFGLDFGGNFGGQAESGDPNLGIWIPQGDPPNIIDPVPADPNAARVFEVEFTGDAASGETITLTVSGVDNSAGEQIAFTVSLSGATFPTASDMAEETQRVFQLASPSGLGGRPFTVSRSGNTVVVSTVAGSIFVDVDTNQAPGTPATLPRVSTLQSAADGSGTPKGQTAYGDWWTTDVDPGTGQVIEVLAPTSGTEYTNSGFIVAEFQLRGITLGAQRAVDASPNRGLVSVTASVNTLLSSYSGEFADLADRLATSAWSDFIDNASVGTISGGQQQRTGITVQLADNYVLGEQFVETKSINFPSGYKLLFKENIAENLGIDLPQITEVDYFTDDTNQNGNVYTVEVDGVLHTETISGATQADIETAIAALQASINGQAGFSAVLNGADVIEITGAVLQEYEVSAFISDSGSTLRVVFRTL